MKEVWKVYKDTGNYRNGGLWEVSNYGRVKRNGELYECKIKNNGYKVFSTNSLHRAVAELFIPNPENKPCVDHINTNKLDNRACNLRWVSYKENCNNPLTRKHNSEAQSGRIFSIETKKLMSEAKKKNPTKYWLGKNHSEETCKKMSESLKGKTPHNKGKHKVWDNKELNKYHYE